MTISCRYHRIGAMASSHKTIFVPYMPISKRESYDIRLIEPHPVAKVLYRRRDEGFLALGEYLSGTTNAQRRRCKETQPIVMTHLKDGRKTMHVYIKPDMKTTADDDDEAAEGGKAGIVPLPNDPNVDVDIFGGFVVAATSFEGNATEEACLQVYEKLMKCLIRDDIRMAQEIDGGGADMPKFYLAQYGPMHSLSRRTNEIWLPVKV